MIIIQTYIKFEIKINFFVRSLINNTAMYTFNLSTKIHIVLTTKKTAETLYYNICQSYRKYLNE